MQLGIGLDISLPRAVPPTAASYDTDAATYFAAMSSPPGTVRKNLINTLIVGLKADGVWTLLDRLALMASHDQQSGLLDAKQPAKTLSAVNSPTFTVDRGFTGDGATAYLTTSELANAVGNNYAQNSAHVGVYCNVSSATAALRYHVGLLTTGNMRLSVRSSGAATTYRANDGTNTTLETVATTKLGHRVIVRPDASNKIKYLNGTSLGTDAIASVGVPATNTTILADGGSTFADDRLAVFHMGQSLDATKTAALYARLVTYLTAIGAN